MQTLASQLSAEPMTSARTQYAPGYGDSLPFRLEQPRQYPMRARVVACLMLFGLAAGWRLVIAIAPSPTGLGSHTQLGLPPCTFPMLTGFPCPTCGMTTSVAYAARGHVAASFHAQPAGLALSFAIFLFTACAAVTLLTGRAWKLSARVTPALLVGVPFAVLMLGWGIKIAMGLAEGTLPFRR